MREKQRRAEIPKSLMAMSFARGSGPTGEGEKDPIRIVFQSPLIPLFGLYPSSSTFPKRERKRKVYLLGKRTYYHVYCKTFVTLQSPKTPPEFIPQGGRGVESLSRSDSYRKREGRFTKVSPGVYPARREGSCGGRLIIRFLTAKSYTSFRISCSE